MRAKFVYILLQVAIFCAVLFVHPVRCFAMDTGFIIDDISEEDIPVIWERFKIEAIDEPELSEGFGCYDISDTGKIALGFDLSGEDVILVYSSEGAYLYGFSFVHRGSFGLEWDNENIILYSSDNLAVCIDKSGKCHEMKRITVSIENSVYWQDVVRSPTRIRNGCTYHAKRQVGISDFLHGNAYTRLIKTNSAGEDVVLFDNSESLPEMTSFVTIGGGILFLVAVVGFIIVFKKVITASTGDGGAC